jgi:hypothetical protein
MRALTSIAAACATLVCCDQSLTAALIYVPPVVFSGTVKQSALELRGHRFQPNTCELHGDTVKMFMCSQDYSPGSTPTGCYMRLEIYPMPRDSGDTVQILLFGARNMLLRFTDHREGITQSYQVTPADTIYVGSERSVGAHPDNYSPQHGAAIHLTEITAQAPAMFGTNGVEPLTIEDGTITGTVP